jgi:hypothetical protein
LWPTLEGKSVSSGSHEPWDVVRVGEEKREELKCTHLIFLVTTFRGGMAAA